MARQYNAISQNTQNFLEKGIMARVWYFFLAAFWKGMPPGSELGVVPGASPYQFTASQGGFMIVNGGAVLLVRYSRDGITNYATGRTQGFFPLSQGDSLIVSYSAAPTLTWVPQ